LLKFRDGYRHRFSGGAGIGCQWVLVFGHNLFRFSGIGENTAVIAFYSDSPQGPWASSSDRK